MTHAQLLTRTSRQQPRRGRAAAPPAYAVVTRRAEQLQAEAAGWQPEQRAAAPLHADLQVLAYSLYVARGEEPGHELEDWLLAEYLLLGAPTQ